MEWVNRLDLEEFGYLKEFVGYLTDTLLKHVSDQAAN
jgi:hypothetical protein